MNVSKVLSGIDELIGTVQTVQGVLMENNKSPFLGNSTSDWLSGQCLHLHHEEIFNILFESLFPHVIGGGDSLFYYPTTVVGRIDRNPSTGIYSISELKSIIVDIDDKQISINLIKYLT